MNVVFQKAAERKRKEEEEICNDYRNWGKIDSHSTPVYKTDKIVVLNSQ